jgi:hypothetical protein
MIYDADLITASEAACVLQNHLGSYRAWGDFLSDCIRFKQHIAGYTLLPRAKLACVRGYRPAYSVADIKMFIRAVKAAIPDINPGIKPVAVRLDTARNWRVSKFDRQGKTVAANRAVGL